MHPELLDLVDTESLILIEKKRHFCPESILRTEFAEPEAIWLIRTTNTSQASAMDVECVIRTVESNNVANHDRTLQKQFFPTVCSRLSSLAQPCSCLSSNMDDKRAVTTQSSNTKPNTAGICVLAVDDDVTCLKIVEVMLRAFQYEVVTVKHASAALAILRERQGGFDIVLTDLHMPEMDGLALLERVEVEYKIPVVMMSADDKEIVMSRCLDSGASFYLTKPLSKSDLSNLWQFVYLKKLNDMVIEQIGSDSESPKHGKVSKEDGTDCASSVNESNWRQESRKKSSRKKDQNEEVMNKYGNAAQKKSRVVWNYRLHNKFLAAIDRLGLHRAVPKKIVELMNIPGLTRENVASHLQKYRIFLKQLNEVTQSITEPSIIRSLTTSGALKSSFALGHPSLLLNMERGFSRISEQQHLLKSFEPRHGSCSTSQQRYGICKPRRSHRKLKQPSVDRILLTNQRDGGNYSSFQMKPPDIRTGSSSSYGGTLTSRASGTDTYWMIHQQAQARTGHFAHASIDDHNLNATSLTSKDFQNVRSTRSFNNFNSNQVPIFNYNNDGFAGIQMNSIEKLSGFSQNPVGIGPLSGTNCGHSKMDEIQNGKMPVVDTGKSPLIPGSTSSHFDYAAQGFASSSGLMPQVSAPSGGFMPQALASSSSFVVANPFSQILSNVSQEPPLVPPPPPQPQQQQQNDIGVGEEVDDLFESKKHDSPFGNISSAVSFDDNYINEILLEPVDQSSN